MELTPGQVRALPWPDSLLAGQPLQTREAYEVGRIIVKQLQGGEALQAQARREWSLRNIAKTIDVGSTATLGRCVQVYWVCEALGISSRLEDLPPHLLITAARLPVKQQLSFINKGIKARWTRNHAIERANELVGNGSFSKNNGNKNTSNRTASKSGVIKTSRSKQAIDKNAGKTGDKSHAVKRKPTAAKQTPGTRVRSSKAVPKRTKPAGTKRGAAGALGSAKHV